MKLTITFVEYPPDGHTLPKSVKVKKCLLKGFSKVDITDLRRKQIFDVDQPSVPIADEVTYIAEVLI